MGETPLLLLIDVQREYTTAGRPFHLQGIGPSLENCRRLLGHAREKSWPIAHVRHVQQGQLFNEALPYSLFVEGFEPRAEEMVFTKGNLSCYTNDGFRRLMEAVDGEPVFLAGYNSLMCCLSTLIQAFHEGQRLNFVADASLARATAHADEQTAHLHATDIISIYANLVKTSDVLQANQRAA
jgi:nicotinamidase-related amidase